jgi:hypothetical protein
MEIAHSRGNRLPVGCQRRLKCKIGLIAAGILDFICYAALFLQASATRLARWSSGSSRTRFCHIWEVSSVSIMTDHDGGM